MKRPLPRKLLAALAVTAGVVLGVFEARAVHSGDGESYFWIGVAGLLIAFGLAEAFLQR